MPFEILVTLMQTNKEQIAFKTARDAVKRQLPIYSVAGYETLKAAMLPAIDVIERYLTSGEPSEYRDYIARTAETRFTQGHTSESVLIIEQLLIDTIKDTLGAALPGDDNERARQWLERSLSGLMTVANATIVAMRLRHATTNRLG